MKKITNKMISCTSPAMAGDPKTPPQLGGVSNTSKSTKTFPKKGQG